MRFIIFSLSCLLAAQLACAQDLIVSAAISLQEPLTDVARAIERDPAKHIELNFGATGLLLAQIRDGAPVDVFVSASDAEMDKAQSMKLIDPATRRVIALNALVLIVPADATTALRSFAGLAQADVKRIAIGQPKIVPAGEYAAEVLKTLKLQDALENKLIYGSSVRQVLDYVERGEVDAGIVYATDAIAAGAKVRLVATAKQSWHDPIRYVAAAVSASKQSDAARGFIADLLAPEGQAALRRHGFVAPTTRPAMAQPAKAAS